MSGFFAWSISMRRPISGACGLVLLLATASPCREMHLNPKVGWSVEVGIRTAEGHSFKARVDSGGECAVYGKVSGPGAGEGDEPGWASATLSEDDLSAVLNSGLEAVGDFELRCGRGASNPPCTISVTVESGGLSIWRRRSFADFELSTRSREGAIVKKLCQMAPGLVGGRVPECFGEPTQSKPSQRGPSIE